MVSVTMITRPVATATRWWEMRQCNAVSELLLTTITSVDNWLPQSHKHTHSRPCTTNALSAGGARDSSSSSNNNSDLINVHARALPACPSITATDCEASRHMLLLPTLGCCCTRQSVNNNTRSDYNNSTRSRHKHNKASNTIQNRVSSANPVYCSIVDRTLNIKHISTIINLQQTTLTTITKHHLQQTRFHQCHICAS